MGKSKDKKVEIREVVYSQDDEKSFGDIFVYEPENVEERNLGSLFIIGELKDLPRNSSYVVNLLASKIKKEFYSNTKRSAEDSLEEALSVANQTISEIAEQGNGEYVSKLSMICGTCKGNKFFLSQVGKVKSLLVRNGQIIEVIKEDDNKPASPKRAFTNIASGELADGDLIILATTGLFNVFSFEKLRQLATSMELDEFAAALQEEVEEEDNEIVSALIMEINGGKKEQPMEHIAANLESKPEEETGEEYPLDKVMENAAIAKTEEDRAEDIKEIEEADKEPASGKQGDKKPEPDIVQEEQEIKAPAEEENTGTDRQEEPAESEEKKIPKAKVVEAENVNDRTVEISEKDADKISLSDIISEYEKMESKPKEEKSAEKDKRLENIVGKKESADFQDLDDQPGKGFAQKIGKKLKGSISRASLGGVKSSLSEKLGKLSPNEKKEYRIKSASSSRKLLAGKKSIIAIVIVLAFVAAIYPKLSKNNNVQEDRSASYQALLSESQNKLTEAENRASSGSNEQDTGKLFFDAKALALRVRDEYDGLDSEANTIISKAQEELDKIDKVVKIENMQTIASFDNDSISNFVEIAGAMYAIDGKENTVYKVDTAKSQIAQIAKANSKIGEIKYAQNFQNQEILFSDGSAVSSFGLKSDTIQKLDAALDPVAKDMAVYGKNIYFLSPSASQIYKYQKTAQGLTGKSDWLKSGDVKDAVSMAVDQNIFVLYSDGQVKKFFTGQEASDNGSTFSIKQPVDAITSATKIFTQNGQKNLYILEPGKGRILIYDKTTGELVKQLAGEGLSDLKDISVDAKETALTALMKGKIVKINL